MRKRFLSALLAFCMVLTILPGTALASEPQRGYYGSKLSSSAQIVYDALCQNIDKIAADEAIYIPIKRLMGSEIKTDTELDAIEKATPSAWRAFNADRPDVFWSHGRMSYGKYIADDEGNIQNSYYLEQEYNVGVTIKMPVGVSWSTGGRSISSDRAAVSSKVADIVAEAKQQSTKAEQLKYAHDWLTSHNAYNQTAANTQGYVNTDCTPWAAISALNIDPGLAPVCEGYSKAFKLICDGLGVPCVLVSGKGNGVDHAWNYVQLGGKWYAVDVTFDDPILTSGGSVDGSGRDTYFLVGKNTPVDGTRTFSQTHINDTGADALKFPALADEKYDPATAPEVKDIGGAVVTVTPDSMEYTGSALTPAVSVTLDGTVLTAGTDYTVAYKDNIEVGEATVTVTGIGNYEGTAIKTFTITAAAPEVKDISGAVVTVTPDSMEYTGSALTPAVSVTLDGTVLAADTDYTVAYSNNIEVGTATVTVTGKGSYTGTATANFTITAAAPEVKDISGAVVTVTPDSMEYTGSALTPAVSVTLDGTVLTAGTDYTVAYKDNIEVGTATVTVTGIGNYEGTVTKAFTITDAEQPPVEKTTITDGMVTLEYTTAPYTGSALTPAVTVKDGETTLTAGTDYTVVYSNNINVGEATVTVTGIGDYEGTVTKTFTITDAEQPPVEKTTITGGMVTLEYTAAPYTGSALTPAVTVKDGETTLTAGTDYTVVYSNNINVGEATVTVTGIGNYEGTATKTFTITDAEQPPVEKTTITGGMVTLEYTTAPYTGSALTPAVTVKDGETTLTAGTDYTVVYSNNINVGEATVTVTGIGNYEGTATKTFTITAASVTPTDPIVSADDLTVEYTGSPIRISSITKTSSVPGSWTFADAVPTAVGTYTLTLTFTPTDTTRYNTVSATMTLTITRAAYTATAEDITIEIGKTPVIKGTASVDGKWTFVDTVDTTTRGSYEVKVLFTPDDAAYESVERIIWVYVTNTRADVETVPGGGITVTNGNHFNPDGYNPRTKSESGYYQIDVTVNTNYSIRDLFARMFRNISGEVYNGLGGFLGDWNADEGVFTPSTRSTRSSSYVDDIYILVPTKPDIEVQAIRVNVVEDEEYYINVLNSDGGNVVPSTRYAESGERVSLYIHPDNGYELDTLTVKDSRGRTITCRSLGDDAYYFYMPSARVTVEAVFTESGKGTDAAGTPAAGTPEDPDSVYNQPFTGLGTPGISGIVLNPAAMPFTDVKGPDWYYNYVEYVWKHYLMSGTSDVRFDPNVTTSRAMIWTILARMNNVRTDINPGSTWFEKGMLWAMEKGVTDGSNAMGDITREQLATMLWRNAGSPAAGGDLSRFSDSADVSAYAQTAVRWAASSGILSGINGRIEPQGTATRAQVAAMVARYGDKLVR